MKTIKDTFLVAFAISLFVGAAPLVFAADGRIKAADAAVKNVVLVHGAWADGSGWLGVYNLLTQDGYVVTVVQNPLTSLADDVAATKRAIAESSGHVILVGHSHGGTVVTEAGTDSKVAGVVYLAAFAPDAGESTGSLSAKQAQVSGVTPPPVLAPKNGFLMLDRSKFPLAFAADVRPEQAAFMAASQVPFALEDAQGKITEPAWRVKPTWYLVSADDHMIPPSEQRSMAKRAGAVVREAEGSHAIYVSQPEVVTELIEEAARDAHK